MLCMNCLTRLVVPIRPPTARLSTFGVVPIGSTPLAVFSGSLAWSLRISWGLWWLWNAGCVAILPRGIGHLWDRGCLVDHMGHKLRG